MERFVKVTLDARFVAAEAGEDIGIASVLAEDEGVKFVSGGVFVFFGERFGIVPHAELEEGGFHGADTVEAPGVHEARDGIFDRRA